MTDRLIERLSQLWHYLRMCKHKDESYIQVIGERNGMDVCHCHRCGCIYYSKG